MLSLLGNIRLLFVGNVSCIFGGAALETLEWIGDITEIILRRLMTDSDDSYDLQTQRTKTAIPLSIRSTLQSPHSDLHHLILVPGHAIWIGCEATEATRDADWILEPMQKGGSVKTFISHITHASQLAVQDPEALLIYSGGQTRAHSDMSEATSYARLAKAGDIYAQFVKDDPDHRFGIEFERVTTEEYALDSFENILFSIARFKECVLLLSRRRYLID